MRTFSKKTTSLSHVEGLMIYFGIYADKMEELSHCRYAALMTASEDAALLHTHTRSLHNGIVLHHWLVKLKRLKKLVTRAKQTKKHAV